MLIFFNLSIIKEEMLWFAIGFISFLTSSTLILDYVLNYLFYFHNNFSFLNTFTTSLRLLVWDCQFSPFLFILNCCYARSLFSIASLMVSLNHELLWFFLNRNIAHSIFFSENMLNYLFDHRCTNINNIKFTGCAKMYVINVITVTVKINIIIKTTSIYQKYEIGIGITVKVVKTNTMNKNTNSLMRFCYAANKTKT